MHPRWDEAIFAACGFHGKTVSVFPKKILERYWKKPGIFTRELVLSSSLGSKYYLIVVVLLVNC